ncbi:MAG: hypothetical protein ABIH11_03815 [Candidatus Altiarchaeota archaeon]
MLRHLTLVLTIFLLIAGIANGLYSGDDAPRKNVLHLAGCLLGLLQSIYPYIMLAFIMYGSAMYVSSGSDQQQRIMGKKYVVFAIVGAICILALLSIAQGPPFGVTPKKCIGQTYSSPLEFAPCKPTRSAEDRMRVCRNSRDDDCDGLIDCHDTDCISLLSGSSEKRKCRNSRDDDCDGLIDCADPDCAGARACRQNTEDKPRKCRNGKDDDGDGLIDCADPDCVSALAGKIERKCRNSRDDDCDGALDCADSDCFGKRGCPRQTTTTTTLPSSQCVLIGGGDNPGGKLDVVFVGSGFPSLSSFRTATNNMRDQLIGGDGIAPYTANANKIAVWRVEKNYDSTMSSDYLSRDGQVTSLAGVCPFFNSIGDRAILLSVEPRFRSFAFLGGNAHVCIGSEYVTNTGWPLDIGGYSFGDNREEVERTMIHETGHAFSELRDEYVSGGGIPSGLNCAYPSSQCNNWDAIDSNHVCSMGCTQSNWYRSSENSVMNYHYTEYYFNEVCKYYLQQDLDKYSG